MPVELRPDWELAFQNSPYWLRFEGSEGNPSSKQSYVTMFTRSYDRARTLTRALFGETPPISILAADPDPARILGAERHGWQTGSAWQHLEELLRHSTENAIASWSGFFWPMDREEAEKSQHRALQLSWDQTDVLLWNQIAADMGVSPQAPVQSKLLDPTRGLMLHAYDDRGLDIIALGGGQLDTLYREYNNWLLDYDRERMKAIFEG
ncbi:MAG: DUF3885 domain-containing protein [Erythrobacter sp.]|uniref:DUF3885 domain-containing protein n=1 Tax=Erythrobacter sp. TaxID=1042 RepID=UPI003296978D